MNLVTARKIAADLEIKGRSKMNKADLISAITTKMDEIHDAALLMDTNMFLDAMEAKYGKLTPITAESIAKAPKSTPMGAARRADNYYRQNGSERLTAKQARRLAKKIFRNRRNERYVYAG
jgi:hypothetical protein